MREIWSVLKHEWLRLRVNPASYLLLAVTALIWFFLFFRQFFLIGQASLRPLFELFPWLAIIFLPALAMGALAKEKSERTIELLLTHPVKSWQVLIGKFFSLLSLPVLLTLTSIPLAVAVSTVGHFDWGAYVVQVLATWLFSAAIVAFALAFSAFLRDQVAALLSSVTASFMWLVLGSELITSRLPLQLGMALNTIAITTHISALYRGVIDFRDVWYFFSVTVLCLAVSWLYLERQKFGRRRQGFAMLQQAVLLLAIVTVLSNIVGQNIPGRIDLTQSRLYSLSNATKSVVADVPDVVTLTLYVSNNVPAQLQPVLRDTKDLLADYHRLGGSRVQVMQKDPSTSDTVQQEAEQLGVQAVQFNVISQEEFNVKSGYFGLVISYADQHQTLPFIQSTDDLEYQITSLMYQMTRQDKPKIAFAAGHGEKSEFGELSAWGQQLSRQFDVIDINLTVTDDQLAEPIDPQTKVLVIDAPTSTYEPAVTSEVLKFVDQGGSLLLLGSGLIADPQTQTVAPVEHNLNTLLAEFQLQIESDFVYDVKSNETIRVGQGPIQYLMPYPLWVKAATSQDSPIVASPQAVTVTWGSSITAQSDALAQAGWQLSPLIVTSSYAGLLQNAQSIAPDSTFDQTNLATQTLAVSLAPITEGSKGRVVVIGSGDLLINELVQASPGNATVGTSAISWLAGDSVLSGLTTKTSIDRSMVFRFDRQTVVLSVLSYTVVLLLPGILGAVVFWRRSRLSKLTFQKGSLFRL